MAFSDVSKGVALNASSIEVVEVDLVALTDVHRERMQQSAKIESVCEKRCDRI